MSKEVIELCTLNINVYRCISEEISTDRVVLTDKQIIHMENSHPEAYKDVISGWKISEKRLQSYLRNKKILYTKEQN